MISIIMGSTSDLPVMEKAAKFLDEMEIPFEMNALSAHRTPDEVEQFAREAEGRGVRVIIAGAGMAAALALGAEGVQVGTRFALTQESSASEAFKQLCLTLKEGDTMLSLKKVSPTRLIRNEFFRQVAEAEDRGAGAQERAA